MVEKDDTLKLHLNDPIDINNVIINTNKIMEHVENNYEELKGNDKKEKVVSLVKDNIDQYKYDDETIKDKILEFVNSNLAAIIDNNIAIVNGSVNIEKNVDVTLDHVNDEFNEFFVRLKNIITDEDLRDITQLIFLAGTFYLLIDEIIESEKTKKEVLVYCFKRLIVELNNLKPREKRDLIKFITNSLPNIIDNQFNDLDLNKKIGCC